MDNVIRVAKAFSDINRLRILNALYKKRELCACQVAELLGISSPSVSRHMDLLKSAGLISARNDGKWVYYSLSNDVKNGGNLAEVFSWFLNQISCSEQIKEDESKLDSIVSYLSTDSCKK